jgi:uncharacterized membrane protein YhaH (DUF805 family)
MGFGQAITSGFSKYVEFGGRARRSEYWYWVLFQILAYFVVSLISIAVGAIGAVLLIVLALGLLLPSLAVTVRRLHDTDRSGWWFFIALVPAVGGIILIIFECQPGTPGENRFGPATA